VPIVLATLTGVAQAATGQAVPALARFDTGIEQLLSKWQIPGAAVAVVKDGRLVLARGYGVADRATGRLMQPDMLVRVASVSKPITATAAMRLVQEGKLALDQPVFALLGVTPSDPRASSITVRQLMEHTSGWDNTAPRGELINRVADINSLSGTSSPPPDAAVIRYVAQQPLDFAPGTRYGYSNTGFYILGQVIEKVAGQKFEHYVRSFYAGAGVNRLRLAKGPLAQRLPDESGYHPDPGSSQVDSAYPEYPGRVFSPDGGYVIDTYQGAGQWLASAIDIARIMNAADGVATKPDLISPATFASMTERPSVGFIGNGIHHGKGWMVQPFSNGTSSMWYTGSLPGHRSYVTKYANGVTWVTLFNQRVPDAQDSAFSAEVNQVMSDAQAGITQWPSNDLFDSYPSVLAATVAADSVVTYHIAAGDRYFMTGNAGEISFVDSGGAGPWKRTGDNFLAPKASANPAGTVPVCRFYGSVTPGPNSHFFTASADECNSLRALQASTPSDKPRWNYEGIAFHAALPANGQCPDAFPTRIYRLYNNGFSRAIDSNHRFTPSITEYQRLQTEGWSGEGVVMCMPY
jgi:CubicO group peptidase (beta-lactamase class C family)